MNLPPRSHAGQGNGNLFSFFCFLKRFLVFHHGLDMPDKVSILFYEIAIWLESAAKNLDADDAGIILSKRAAAKVHNFCRPDKIAEGLFLFFSLLFLSPRVHVVDELVDDVVRNNFDRVAFSSNIEAKNYIVVIASPDRKFRISINGVEIQTQIDLGSNILNIRSSKLSHDQDKFLRDQQRVKKELQRILNLLQ